MQDTMLSQGPPPLYASAADASIDLIDLIAAAVRGVDVIDVTPQVRANWQSYLATYYTSLQPQDRQWFANAPTTLGNIHTYWGQVSDQERQMTVQMWANYLPALLQFADPVLHEAQAQQGQYAAQPGPPQPQYGYAQQQQQQYGYDAGDPMSQLLNEVIGEGQRRAAQAPNAQLRAQQEAYNQQVANTMLSNMAAMQHQTMMTIAGNLKA